MSVFNQAMDAVRGVHKRVYSQALAIDGNSANGVVRKEKTVRRTDESGDIFHIRVLPVRILEVTAIDDNATVTVDSIDYSIESWEKLTIDSILVLLHRGEREEIAKPGYRDRSN